ncbi:MULTISPECIES: LLM class flavin-dependent oxidoreductase [Bacillaceae]|uniref:LLM class flavin-dependent oxidoreductase n=1 Tax=Bacillaceae TaxID=186817 RepID=UPI001F40D24D|nr:MULTISPECIES: LLM class flavin-dependent oxidoreductase [Bacillaceae]MCF2649600.1 LLM class flavin-dependent oxidoreductase [Niallia circulans]CAI9386780.1 F420-dependent glucose-6-phosphate dehydrogenase [Bacillus sp. T2.9-1]
MGKTLKDIKFSVLDLAPIKEGSNATESFKNSLELARHVEKWGYNRYWVAEHHSMPGIASSATSVLIGYIAGGTSKIRVGSGGIMLPNHSPLVIAEQFGTLESMYPNRIDLGLGRAPGSDQLTARALRRYPSDGNDFPELVEELSTYLKSHEETRLPVRAIPGEGLAIPIWLLGSSDFSARLAGSLGLPFAFASHFSPDYTVPALHTYYNSFTPSDKLKQPYAMVGVNIIAADTDERAEFLATSSQQQFLSLIRNNPTQLKPPVPNMEALWTTYEKSIVQKQLKASIIGSEETVARKLQAFLDETQADEMIINTQVYSQTDRLRSYEIVKKIVM